MYDDFLNPEKIAEYDLKLKINQIEKQKIFKNVEKILQCVKKQDFFKTLIDL